MPENIGGLPAHPLIIHLPLVLGPVVGLLTLLLLVPKLRDRLLLPTAGLAVLFALAAVLAVMSGENLAKVAGGPGLGAHADAARTLRLLGIVLAAVLVAFAIGRRRIPTAAATGLTVLVAALGVATVAFTVDTGHKGATLVWGDLASGDRSEASSDDDAGSHSGMTAEEHERLENR